MTGLIWFVQIVHYPLFSKVGQDQFIVYEKFHNTLTTWVVGPVMLAEAITALILATRQGGTVLWICLGLLGVIWLSTAFLQVPQHSILEAGFNPEAHRKLVSTNWIRTILWSARALLLTTLLIKSA
jgi:hypothetical protein